MNINVEYDFLKTIASAKNLNWQYVENEPDYTVFVLDDNISYHAILYKPGFEPNGFDPAMTLDFETYYKSTANKPLYKDQQQLIQVIKQSYGTRAWTFSHNFCDKTTWFGDSIRVVGESVGTGDGSTDEFNLDHTYVIDLSHGKISDEDNIVPTISQGGTSFIPNVYIDSVLKTERVFDMPSGGDYTINYSTGVITFFTPPALDAVITADYFYSPANDGSTMYVRPLSGTKNIITAAECQFSADLDLTDTLISAIFTYNPLLGAPPAKFEYPGSRAKFKKFTDFVAYTNGTYPQIPALGGSPRGCTQPIYQLRFEYVVTIPLDDAYGAEMRVWLENHIPYGGEQGQITFYGYQP